MLPRRRVCCATATLSRLALGEVSRRLVRRSIALVDTVISTALCEGCEGGGRCPAVACANAPGSVAYRGSQWSQSHSIRCSCKSGHKRSGAAGCHSSSSPCVIGTRLSFFCRERKCERADMSHMTSPTDPEMEDETPTLTQFGRTGVDGTCPDQGPRGHCRMSLNRTGDRRDRMVGVGGVHFASDHDHLATFRFYKEQANRVLLHILLCELITAILHRCDGSELFCACGNR